MKKMYVHINVPYPDPHEPNLNAKALKSTNLMEITYFNMTRNRKKTINK